jgi:protein-S-isoprenylcysteine O-methyltransferase Ste14
MIQGWMRRYRVAFGFLVGGMMLILAGPTPASVLTGLPFTALGLALRTWSSGLIRKNRELATDGPYAYTRNPLYLGSLLIGLGFALMTNRIVLLVLFLGVFAAVYRAAIREEEAVLGQRFGEAYRRYERTVPRFFPRWPGSRSKGDFDWRLVIQHREYYAWAGAVLGLAWLVWKI